MPTLTVSADDSATAMEEIVQKLGEDSYILSTEKTGGKIHIKATNDIKPEIGRPALKRKKAFQDAMTRADNIDDKGASQRRHHCRGAEVLRVPHRLDDAAACCLLHLPYGGREHAACLPSQPAQVLLALLRPGAGGRRQSLRLHRGQLALQL